MTDNLTKEQRKKNMQNIRSKGTIPEKLVMKELRKLKIHFTKHDKKLPGKPDIVFKRKKIAVFIDSDFWHCNPKRFKMPKTNESYWTKKFERNIKRDKEVNRLLIEMGWKVIRLWEYDIKHNFNECFIKILDSINYIVDKENQKDS